MGGLAYAVRLAGDYGLETHKKAGHVPSDTHIENVVVKVFPTPKPLLEQFVESITGDEAADMYAKETIRALMMRVQAGDMRSLVQDLINADTSFDANPSRLEIDELRFQ